MIKTVDLTKKYGDAFAIKAIDLELQPGDLFGFIGPNGAGKTTTMRIIATLLEPSWGEAYVCDHSVHTAPKEIRRLVGYMPDFFGVYDDMTVVEYLEFFAASYRIGGEDRRKRVNEMLDIVDLDFKRDAFANTLSRGQTNVLGWRERCSMTLRSCCLMSLCPDWIHAPASRCETCCDGLARWARP